MAERISKLIALNSKAALLEKRVFIVMLFSIVVRKKKYS